jgi:hypothetical protein
MSTLAPLAVARSRAPQSRAGVACGETGSLTGADFAVLAGILAVGSVYFLLSQRGASFYSGDTSYIELARSILDRSYGFNFRHETMLPPGFPAIVAVLTAVFSDSHAVMVRAITVFTTLGLGVTYLLLRREAGRTFATAVTTLLFASPAVFGFATKMVFSDLPYLLTSMTALLILSSLDVAETSRTRSVRWVLCGFLMLASLLIRSAGITLVVGLAAWLAVSCWRDPTSAVRRCKTFVPFFLAGLIVQAGWMAWVKKAEAPAEWPIGGYPQSYTSQLRVKNGNEPELGMASAADLPARVTENLAAHAAGFVEAVTGKGGRLPHAWYTPWVIGPILLIILGLYSSVWPTGGKPEDWYFVAHESMYLLWPWKLEMRFILPVVPLACLYFWRGIRRVAGWANQTPNLAMSAGLLLGVVCGVSATTYGWRVGGLRSKLAAECWWLFVIWILIVFWRRRVPAEAVHPVFDVASATPYRHAAVALYIVLFFLNAGTLTGIARENLAFDVARERTYAPILAAKWIRSHTPRNTVVMARHMDVVYHYGERRVVWFPPISDPAVLYDGIRRHHVSLIVVEADRGVETYWRPGETECFERLLKAYPTTFRLVQRGRQEQIYAVALNEADEEPTCASPTASDYPPCGLSAASRYDPRAARR